MRPGRFPFGAAGTMGHRRNARATLSVFRSAARQKPTWNPSVPNIGTIVRRTLPAKGHFACQRDAKTSSRSRNGSPMSAPRRPPRRPSPPSTRKYSKDATHAAFTPSQGSRRTLRPALHLRAAARHPAAPMTGPRGNPAPFRPKEITRPRIGGAAIHRRIRTLNPVRPCRPRQRRQGISRVHRQKVNRG